MKKIKKIHRIIIKLKMLFIPDGPDGDRARGKLYEPFLKSYGKNFKIATQAFIFNPNGLTVGNNVYIGFNTYLGQGEVELNDEVLIGNFVSITASNHLMKDKSFRFGGYHAEKISIGKGTWIGAGSSITAGIKIGKSSLVATGAVVTKDFGDNIVIGGIPAKIISTIDDYNKKY
jgi:maltose O-acetyltransferase